MTTSRRRRRVRARIATVAVAFVLAPAMAILVACGFPEVTYAPDNVNEGGGAQEAGEGSAADTSTIDGNIQSGDSARPPDEELVDASMCETRPICDCDRDGVLDRDCKDIEAGIDAGDGGKKRLGDCNDLDPLRRPDAGYSSAVPPAGTDGDWDCDGVVEPFNKIATCSGLGACGGNDGYITDPGCGNKADIYTCDLIKLPCAVKVLQTQVTQQCK